jgi:hypothetical protein
MLADDWGLRNLARWEKGVIGFSTYALLTVALERELVSQIEFYDYVTRLLRFGHTFLPVDADLLSHAIRMAGYQVDETVLRLLARLEDSDATLESAVGVAVQLVRNLALEPLGKGALGAVTSVLLNSLTTGRDSHQVVQRFLRGTNATLQLARPMLPHTRLPHRLASSAAKTRSRSIAKSTSNTPSRVSGPSTADGSALSAPIRSAIIRRDSAQAGSFR